jgi:hypothetical protein
LKLFQSLKYRLLKHGITKLHRHKLFMLLFHKSQGMIADFSLHDKGDDNPHAHIMLTMRSLSEQGFGKKERAWNDRKNAEIWREAWAQFYNRALEQHGLEERVDHRSYKRQGLDLIPTIHLGTQATRLEQFGYKTERGDLNRQIMRERQRQQTLFQLETEKAALIEQEKTSLANLKNQYFARALELETAKSTQREAQDYRQRGQSLLDLAQFMSETKARKNALSQKLAIGRLESGERAILERQIAQLDYSLAQDRAFISQNYGLPLEQAQAKAQSLLGHAASLGEKCAGGAVLDFEKLVSGLFEKLLAALVQMARFLGDASFLEKLSPFPYRDQLNGQQRQHLESLENRLHNSFSRVMERDRSPTPIREQVLDRGRSH